MRYLQFEAESVTTLSTLDDVKTPDSTGLAAFHFHIDGSPIKGPQGPHLFRSSEESLSRPELTPDWDEEKAPDSAVATQFYTGFKAEPERKNTPVPVDTTQTPPPPPPAPARPASRIGVANWSPNEVVYWMQTLGFEDSIIEKFFVNDINGTILLELQLDDLKELEISSFGKRHQLMACIKQLRRSHHSSSPPSCSSGMSTPDPTYRQDTRTPQTTAAEVGADCTSPVCDAAQSRSNSRPSSKNQHRQPSRQKRGRHGLDIAPEDSVSIVAIEQLLPKLHVCSKGESCRKWQKQQARVARLLKDLQLEGLGGSVLVTGDPGNASQPATKTPKLESKPPLPEKRPSKSEAKPAATEMKSPVSEAKPPKLDVSPPKPELKSPKSDAKTPKSDVTPSLVASSDIMGGNQQTDVQLSQESLDGVQSRDPQENVRNFLNFQRLSALQPVTDPATPPVDHNASTGDSPRSEKGGQSLTNNLRHLPKLRIPSLHAPSESTFSPNYSAQRTITPSVVRKSRASPTVSREKSPNPYSGLLSPSDFYRHDSHYEQRTPLSSGDAPLTAIPVGPIERGCSQSVPPDMRFGDETDGTHPATRKPEVHRRLHSAINGQIFRPMVPVVERSPLPPIDTIEDLENTPKAPHCRNNPFSPGSAHANDIIHSGWMKKRKISKLMRREWEENHFALRGTHLCKYSDPQAALRDSKALERIDVDDYAVACSSLRSNSKLTAAFKKTVLKRVNDSMSPAAFAFSLIPSSNGVVERKTLLPSGPKSHHFSVESQQERIDWMRELMLAKALRRGREGGDTVNLNGQPF